MPLTDDQLFDFDRTRLADFELGDARTRLADLGAVFRSQLVAARFLDGYRERWLARVPSHLSDAFSDDYVRGWDDAMRDVIAHLRQGDLVPGGVLHDEEESRV